jgi:hypothetical protein
MKADPAAYADYLARARMNYRLRQEVRGRKPRTGSSLAIDAYRTANGGAADRSLDPEPLRAWLRAALAQEARHDVDFAHFCQRIGCGDRQLRAILGGQYATVSLHTADRLLTNYGRPVVIRSRDLEARLVAWAHELPGNGTRLLRYMDRAEQVAHLADVSLMSLSDLWPELNA